MKVAWSFPALGGRITGSLHLELGLAPDTRDTTLGWQFTPQVERAPDLTFGVKATRREHNTGTPEPALGVEATARW